MAKILWVSLGGLWASTLWAQAPIPAPLPSHIPPKPQLAGPIAEFTAAIIAQAGNLQDDWTSKLSAPPNVGQYLPGDWHWRGGASIISNRQGHGGLSGLEIERLPTNDLSVLAVSDSGYWVAGELRRQGLDQYDSLLISPPLAIKTRAGHRPGQSQFNAEALAVSAAGDVLVAFEGDHRVQKHLGVAQSPSVLNVPTALKAAWRNGGIEALAALPNGQMFAVGEGLARQGGLRAWVFTQADLDWPIAVYRLDEEDGHPWNPTAAAVMGDQLLIVERWWDRGFTFRTRLVRLALAQVKAGATLVPTPLFELTPFVGAFGNIEGLAVDKTDQGYLAVFVTDNQEIGLLPTMLFVLEFSPTQ